MSSLHSIGAMNQLADALDLAEFTPDYVTKLKQYKELGKIKLLLDGCAEIVQIKHIIDCDANPFCPDNWEVVEHKKGGQFLWNQASISLFLSEVQKSGLINGNELRKELENQLVLNANVLDYLLAHPELIPEEWKGKVIFFWGTIFRSPGGRLCVRDLRWDGSRWYWNYRWLGSGFGSDSPAAVRAS